MARKKRKARRRRRKNPAMAYKFRRARKAGRRSRVVVYRFGRGKKRKLRRSPRARLRPLRVNRRRRSYRRRYRRNPVRVRQFFGKARMMNAISLLAGIGAAGIVKGFASNMIQNDLFTRFYGVASIVLGATLNMKGRKKAVKSVGTGMVVFGIYDLLTQNIPMLSAYLPTIGAPTFLSPAAAPEVAGAGYYGRSVMGASIQPGDLEVVGANIGLTSEPEVVGGGDLADALEMSA